MHARTIGLLRCGLILLARAGPAARAEDLRIGVASLSTSADPHFYNLAVKVTPSLHLFDRLTTMRHGRRFSGRRRASWPTTWHRSRCSTWSTTGPGGRDWSTHRGRLADLYRRLVLDRAQPTRQPAGGV